MTKNRRKPRQQRSFSQSKDASAISQAFTGDSRNMAGPKKQAQGVWVCGKPFAGEWRGSVEQTRTDIVGSTLTVMDFWNPASSGAIDTAPKRPQQFLKAAFPAINGC